MNQRCFIGKQLSRKVNNKCIIFIYDFITITYFIIIHVFFSFQSYTLERERNPNLRTKVLLGHRDLKLNIKLKGGGFYKRVYVEYIGKLPGFSFTKVFEMCPGSPKGRRRFSSDEEEQQTSRKRTTRSESKSPQCPEASKPRIDDNSCDEAWDEF